MKNYLLSILIVTLFVGVSSAQMSQPESNKTINYQGLLTEKGQPITGILDLVVQLGKAQDGSEVLWQDTIKATLVDGHFSIELGANKPFPSPSLMDGAAWLGISVKGSHEQPSRTMLSASPFALNVADGAVTAKKMGTDYVGALSVDGEKITGKGETLALVAGNGVSLKFDKQTKTILIEGNQSSDRAKGGSVLAIPNFDGLTTGTNTTAAMTVGSGASLGFTGTGTVAANQILGSGSTSNAVDLPTGEVNGVLPVANGGSGMGSGTSGAWDLNGNSGTVPPPGSPGNFIGTADDTPLEIHVDNSGNASEGRKRVMRFEPNDSSPNLLGGHNSNFRASGVIGATISGGGFDGSPNVVHDNYGTVGGGAGNIVGNGSSSIEDETYATVSGGSANLARGVISTVAGGWGNWALQEGAVVGGGDYNEATGEFSTIAGGHNNHAGKLAFVGGGGDEDHINPHGGPYGNDASGDYSVVVGGKSNVSEGEYSIIGGGIGNRIDNTYQGSSWAGILGGYENLITSSSVAVIGGGTENRIEGSTGSVIAGGNSNTIYGSLSSEQDAQTISGGEINYIESGNLYGAIGGGKDNRIDYLNSGQGAVIPGGYGLRSHSNCQTTLGMFNSPRLTNYFASGYGYSRTSLPRANDWLLNIGNGSSDEDRNNAFEVSYNGHSIVNDVNGRGDIPVFTARPAIQGATYRDNVCYGWGEVTGNLLANNFGVASVLPAGVGTYNVTLNTTDKLDAPITINGVAVVTLKTAGLLFVTATPVVAGTFTVSIKRLNQLPPPPEGGCCPIELQAWDADFMFTVFGR
jgi:hypothetical protein